jgi:hypothetical protein
VSLGEPAVSTEHIAALVVDPLGILRTVVAVREDAQTRDRHASASVFAAREGRMCLSARLVR